MPDITMCDVANCSKSSECYRHKDSGTRASDYQYYFVRPDDYSGPCDYFWPTHDRKVTDYNDES